MSRLSVFWDDVWKILFGTDFGDPAVGGDLWIEIWIGQGVTLGSV